MAQENEVDIQLLMALLAIQQGIAAETQVVAAWGNLKSGRSILIDLLAQGVPEDKLKELEALVGKYITRHGGVSQSLASLEGSDLDVTLAQLRDSQNIDLDASVAKLAMLRVINGTGSQRSPSSGGSRYRIVRALSDAAGGMGVIAVARDQELGREVAVKQIQEKLVKDSTLRRRFELEARVTGSLEHPGIIPIYGFGVSADGAPYYAMRLVQGDNLAERITAFHQRRQAGQINVDGIELRALVDRLIDVAQAVAYAHSRGILHRDLKPGNILLGKFGETLVIDWGLAGSRPMKRSVETSQTANDNERRQQTAHAELLAGEPTIVESHSRVGLSSDATQVGTLDLGTLDLDGPSATAPDESSDAEAHAELRDLDRPIAGSFLGTPGFAPPEQVAGKLDELDERSDVFALGAILYQILAGHAPFTKGKKKRAEVKEATLKGQVDDPRKADRRIPKALAAICMRCLSVDKELRYTSAQALIADLNNWKADLPVSALAESRVQSVARWIRKNQAKAAALVSSLLVLLIVGAGAVKLLSQIEVERARSEAEATRREAAEKDAEISDVKAAAATYYQWRTDFENVLLLKQPGWLNRARNLLANAPPMLGVDDRAWRESSRRQLQVSQELVQLQAADSQAFFTPASMQFTESGSHVLVGKFKPAAFGLAFTYLLYNSTTKSVEKVFTYSIPSAMTDALSSFLKTGIPAAQDKTHDVLISESLDLIFAITKGGRVFVWNIQNNTVAPEYMEIGETPIAQRLAIDESNRHLYIGRKGSVEQYLVTDRTLRLVRAWPVGPYLGDLKWDANSKRLFVAGNDAIYVIETTNTKPVVTRLDVPAHRLHLVSSPRSLVAMRAGLVSFVDADSLELHDSLRLVDVDTEDFETTDLSLSDDGVYLAYTGQRQSQRWAEVWNLASMSRLGAEIVNETILPGFQFRPGTYELARQESSGLSWWTVDNATPPAYFGMGARPLHSATVNAKNTTLLLGRLKQAEIWSQLPTRGYTLASRAEFPDRPRVSIAADGSAGMHYEFEMSKAGNVLPSMVQGQRSFGELARVPVKVAIFDRFNENRLLTVEHQSQQQLNQGDYVRARSAWGQPTIAEWSDWGAAKIFSGRGGAEALETASEAVFVGMRNGTLYRLSRDLSNVEATRGVFADQAVCSVISMSPDQTRLAVGSRMGDAFVLDPNTLQPQLELPKHAGGCTGLEWVSDQILVSAGADGHLRCLDMAGSEAVRELWHLNFSNGIVELGTTESHLWVLLRGERALRMYSLDSLVDR